MAPSIDRASSGTTSASMPRRPSGGEATGQATGPALTPGTDRLEAYLTFAAQFSGPPVNYFDVEPPPGAAKRFPTRRVCVTLEDGRRDEGLSLEGAGFVLRQDARSVMPDFHDPEALRRIYHRHMERLVQECTGARRVVVFDHTHRSSAVASRVAGGTDATVDQAHNDYSAQSGPDRVREALEQFAPDEDLQRAMSGRYAIINVWRPTNGVVEQRPLALCDRRSIDPEDFVAAELRWAHRTGRVAVLRHNPGQRWLHFPQMSPTEALVFTCFDSAANDWRRVSAHTAFDLPNTPADARPRHSIEVRTVALF